MTSRLFSFPHNILLFPTGKLPSPRWAFSGLAETCRLGLIVLPVAVFSLAGQRDKVTQLIKPNDLLGGR